MNNLSSYNSLDKKDRIDFYIAIAVIISVLIFILYFSFSDLFAEKESSSMNTNTVAVQLDDTIVIDGQEYIPMVQKPKSKKKNNEIEPVEDASSNAIIDSTLNESKFVSESDNIDSEIIDQEIVLQDTIKRISTTLLTENLDSTENGANDTISSEVPVMKNDVITSDQAQTEEAIDNELGIDKSCIIAVGLYGEKTNADKMIKRLESGGYNPFISSRGRNYQVQIYHTCNRLSLNKSLENIRKEYASDAIVLIRK